MNIRGSLSTKAVVFVSVFIAVFLPFTSTCKPGELMDPRLFVLNPSCRPASMTAVLVSVGVAGIAAWLASGLSNRHYYI